MRLRVSIAGRYTENMSETNPREPEPPVDAVDSTVDQDEVDDAVRDAMKDTTKMSADDIAKAIKDLEDAPKKYE